jgi:putative hydrolase of the HAD superfamily
MPSGKGYLADAAHLDAVTVDAMGTLVELDDPVGRLGQALRERGVERSPDEVARAFAAEVEYYVGHKLGAADQQALADLRRECARVFLEAGKIDLDPAEFAPTFVAAVVFRPLEGAVQALERLRAAGLALACVSDWDIGLDEQLELIGLGHLFALVLTSAEVGAEKPDPMLFVRSVDHLGVDPGRAVHVGDGEADREGAEAAGLAFEPVPLATLPERLGVR